MVLVLVGVLASTVILGFTGADTQQRLKGSAQQLADTIELARQYALQRNREWGLYVEPDKVEFVEFDPDKGTWAPRTERPFGHVEILDNVQLKVKAEGPKTMADDQDLPKIILFSSGEVTPFTLYMVPEWNSPGWRITSDGISRAEAEREELP